MERNEIFNWLKEHDNKCSIKQLKELGLILKEDVSGVKQLVDSDGNICLIGYIETDNEDTIFTVKEYPIVEPVLKPKTDEVIKSMEKWLDTAHYERSISIRDLNKKFYDKFYERKGRKYSHNR